MKPLLLLLMVSCAQIEVERSDNPPPMWGQSYADALSAPVENDPPRGTVTVASPASETRNGYQDAPSPTVPASPQGQGGSLSGGHLSSSVSVMRVTPLFPVLLLVFSACASQAETEETFHELATPSLAMLGGYLGAVLGPIGSGIGAGIGATFSEMLVSKGVSEARKEGQRELIDVLNSDDPDTPLPKRLAKLRDAADRAEKLGELANKQASSFSSFFTKVLWGIAGLFGVLLALQWLHFRYGSLRSRKLAKKEAEL